MSDFYANAPVYDSKTEAFLSLVWRFFRKQTTSHEINEYLTSDIQASVLDFYCPLDALIRLGYSEAKARQMLKDEDLEELL